ncbi:hypothetical protein RJ639_027471 [Escallonia herrerae]|uniref:Uncharacterized protein n=1 Tax=Escallonia herrerae TaxID=1293975 RepID=A0AA89BPB7_9ASTE|nr:hypothetical protein RJ639_027471 [Escallonia herrerae]
MLAGVPPFYGETPAENLEAVLRGNLRFPTRIFLSVLPEAKDLLRKMLCKDPSKQLSADQILKRGIVTCSEEQKHELSVVLRQGEEETIAEEIRRKSGKIRDNAWCGQAQEVSYLCKNKADVGAAAMDDMGAVHFAAQKRHLEVVRILISSGASVKASTRKGMTALHYAVQGNL